ncbi:uncharacterized protein SPPG_04452 [Spizellomyces punctatus DAOM BR117]|uniref:Uncharacterized protein n=1 Tax=Spizellomyces punctatus (strain DAOM BR117) TaxID=645134 RepID=A0A0L0HGX1_SPIPD|nr:uncharacterized protein SPPG_04452 [Spizellomyces punctatus DAOM BR117]KND00110.1 hypothetical protein SPPG_04452 [Spizellomyces punctatus DAOM BR117]|eukprot:XP_016608149.1 hypothetical protein SPPG_04452 [Spizellomyces punctatus DAOM BR117]
MDALLETGRTAITLLGSISLLCATISFVWFVAWKLILHQIPFFREIVGSAGFTQKPEGQPARTSRRRSRTIRRDVGGHDENLNGPDSTTSHSDGKPRQQLIAELAASSVDCVDKPDVSRTRRRVSFRSES